jgi:probable O-glycosylation ligase (exosortase A-associated)
MYPDEAWEKWQDVSKIFLFVVITLKLFQTRERLRILFLVVALSIGFYGLKGGVWSIFVDFGMNRVQGPEETFIGGNTELGLALNMILPFLLCLSREEPNNNVRRLLQVIFAFSIIAVIFTYSRGAFLGLLVVLAMLFLRAKRRVVGVCLISLLAWFVSVFAPPAWFGRVETIQTFEQDKSANMRLNSWKVAWRLALDHPLTGGGFWVLPHKEIYDRYSPGTEVANTAHSIYFAVLGDHGFPGLVVFVSLNLSILWSLFRLRRKVEGRPNGTTIASYCEMLQASIVAYLVSGAFLQQAYFDLFYHIISFAVLLRVIAVREGLLNVQSQANRQPYNRLVEAAGIYQ